MSNKTQKLIKGGITKQEQLPLALAHLIALPLVQEALKLLDKALPDNLSYHTKGHTLEVLRDAAVALPGLVLGIVGGRLLRPHLSEHWFWRLSMAMLVATSVLAAYGAARSLLNN